MSERRSHAAPESIEWLADLRWIPAFGFASAGMTAQFLSIFERGVRRLAWEVFS
jgi:hypothetical protein